MAEKLVCPECGLELGEDAGVSVYKHAVACMHLPHLGMEGINRLMESRDVGSLEYRNRVKQLMKMAEDAGEKY